MILTVYKVISDTPILKRSCRSFHLRFSRFNSFYSKYGSAFKFLRAANNFDKFLASSIQLETESVLKLYNGIIHYLGWGYKFTPHSKRTSQNFRKGNHKNIPATPAIKLKEREKNQLIAKTLNSKKIDYKNQRNNHKDKR